MDEMLRGGARAFEVDGRESLVDLGVQAQRAAGHGHPLGFKLGLVANCLVGGHGVQHAGLRSGQAELLDGLIVEPQGVLRRARALDSQQSRQRGLVRGQPGADPCGERVRGRCAAGLPGVKVFRCGVDGRAFSRHGEQIPPNF